LLIKVVNCLKERDLKVIDVTQIPITSTAVSFLKTRRSVT